MIKITAQELGLGQKESNLTRHFLLCDWILFFSYSVIIVHSLVGSSLLLFWPQKAPIDVWGFLIGVGSSATVAFFTGILTIVFSWHSSEKLGHDSTKHVTDTLQQSIACTIESYDALNSGLQYILAKSCNIKDSLLVVSFDPQKKWDTSISEIIASRARLDLPTLLAVPMPSWFISSSPFLGQEDLSITFWRTLCAISEDQEFRQRFTNRNFVIIPLPEVSETICVLLAPNTTKTKFHILESLWATGSCQQQNHSAFGIRSSLYPAFGSLVLDRLCFQLSEPVSTYSPSIVLSSDIEHGKLTGLLVTRSIITSQLLLSIHDTLDRLSKSSTFTRSIVVMVPGGAQLDFDYSSEQFIPPLRDSHNHSGSVLAQLLENHTIDVTDKNIWETSAGPGYITMLLSKYSGKGTVLATDICLRSIEIAEHNVKMNGNPESVFFLAEDCRRLQIQTDSDQIKATTPKGDFSIHLDFILIDLPLIPFHGTRELISIEQTYLETSQNPDSHLTPTILDFLKTLLPLLVETKTIAVMPFCAETDLEQLSIIQEVQSICPKCSVQLIGPDDGFIKCIAIAGNC